MDMRTHLAALLLVLLAAPAGLGAQLPGPMPGTSVHDFAGVIADDKEVEINAKARRLKEEYKTEIAVVTVDSLQGEDSFSYSMRMARSWGIGAEEEGSRGLLILVSVKDRTTAFRTSRHTEGELPDSVTGAISREIGEYFKRQDFGGGLSLGMDRVIERVAEGFDPATARPVIAGTEGGRRWPWLLLLLLPAGAAVLLVRGLRRRKAKAVQGRARPRAAGGTKVAAAPPAPSPEAPKRKKNGKRKIKNQPKGTGRVKPPGRAGASSGSPSSSGYSSSDYGSYSSSSSDSSSSSSDSGSSYGGSSDFGGGGSDSSW